MADIARLTEIIEPEAKALGFDLVRVKMMPSEAGDSAQALQIMAEDPKTRRLGVDDCAKISRAVSAIMDVEDPISGNYRLEVSSPGIDRLLVRIEDYEYYKGLEAKVESDTPAENGQRKFRGRIVGAKNNIVTLNTDQGEADIPFPTIIKAKLVLTDELITLTANKEEKE